MSNQKKQPFLVRHYLIAAIAITAASWFTHVNTAGIAG
jgi:hypothetical protein